MPIEGERDDISEHPDSARAPDCSIWQACAVSKAIFKHFVDLQVTEVGTVRRKMKIIDRK